MDRILALVDARKIQIVIVAKLDRLTRSVKDLGELLERFQRRGVSLVSVSESLDTGTAAGRLVLNVMASVSQWEREAIGERTRDALRHKKAQGQRATWRMDRDSPKTVAPWSLSLRKLMSWQRSASAVRQGSRCGRSRRT